MTWSNGIRKVHRWLSLFFTLTVVANFVAIGLGEGEPPEWMMYAPLPPLFLLMFSGLFLFVLPYARRWRRSEAVVKR